MSREYLERQVYEHPNNLLFLVLLRVGLFWESAQWREFVTLLTQGFAFLHLPFYVCLLFVFWDRVSYSPGWTWTLLCNPGWSCTYNSPALPPWCRDYRHAYHTHFYVELGTRAKASHMLGKHSINWAHPQHSSPLFPPTHTQNGSFFHSLPAGWGQLLHLCYWKLGPKPSTGNTHIV